MIQVYTGSGKGKTTAAIGQALRALGYKKKVFLIQFMKKGKGFGELKVARRLIGFSFVQTGRRGWVKKGSATLKDKQLAKQGLKETKQAIKSRKYDLIILDELNLAINYGLLKVKDVKPILKSVPKTTELIITGRYAHPEILRMADLVSEIKEIKHYYKKGIPARSGIEY